MGVEAFTACGGAKIDPNEDSFCQVRRLMAEAMGQEADEKSTAAVNLQPTLPKPDRLLDAVDADLALRHDLWWPTLRAAAMRSAKPAQ